MTQSAIHPDIATRAVSGQRLSELQLRDLQRADLLSLGLLADEARRASVGLRVTYQRVQTLRIADFRESLDIADLASEIRLVETPARLQDAIDLVTAMKHAAGHRWVTGFSLAAVLQRARNGWGDPRHVLGELSQAGLIDFVDIAADELDPLDEAVELARAAGLLARRITIARSWDDRQVEVLERVRNCQERLGGITWFSPLPRTVAVDKPTTGYQDVRMVALSRLALGHVTSPSGCTSIEVDWSLYGPKLAQVALTFGADHLDAVSPDSDDALGRRRGTIAEVERNIRAAGFEPQEYRPVA